MDLQLQDKVVVITGGAKGIGAAIAYAVGRERAVPVIVDRDREAGEKLRAEMMAAGVRCALMSTDLLVAENCRKALERTLNEFGHLHALVNNAGINDRIGLEHGSPDQYVASLHRNLLHYYNMAHYALPELKRSKGSIINMSSKTALTGQ